MTKLSNNVSEEFLDWLQECPYQWYLDDENNDILKYTFIIKKKWMED